MNNIGEFLVGKTDKYAFHTFAEITKGYRTERYTFFEINRFSQQVAAYLQKQNIIKGDRIVLWGSNSPEWVICFFGALRCGVVAVPIDARISYETAKKYIYQTKPKLLFISKQISFPKDGQKRPIIFLEEIKTQITFLTPIKDAVVEPNDLAEIIFTSGTTGSPKGVMLTHKNILTSIAAFYQSFVITPEFKLLSILPLSHIYEQIVGLFLPIQGGASVVYLIRVNSTTIMKAFRRHHITAILVVPRILHLLLEKISQQAEKQHLGDQFNALMGLSHFIPSRSIRSLLFLPVHRQFGRNLQIFVSGAAPLEENTGKAWERMGFTVYQGYGSTETTALTAINLTGGSRLAYAGKAAPQTEIIIAKDGEVLVKGPAVFPGYWRDEAKTRQQFQKNWYKTGDIGYLDQDDWLYLYGREKFRIVLPDGSKVYPEDIERKLNSNPKINDSCVLGLEEQGEKMVHAVLLTDFPQEAHSIITQVNKSL